MREILYRGQATDQWNKGKWIIGSYHFSHLEEMHTISFINQFNEDDWQFVAGKTVGQYTGLKDKNKKKAFEGDKIYIEGCYLGYISLIDGGFNLIEESNQSGSNIINQSRMNKMEIIGNIHDSPELLEIKC